MAKFRPEECCPRQTAGAIKAPQLPQFRYNRTGGDGSSAFAHSARSNLRDVIAFVPTVFQEQQVVVLLCRTDSYFHGDCAQSGQQNTTRSREMPSGSIQPFA
ncbi:MAG TPA: hypothetical protein VGV39_13435 [Mesorhizobium sp.]|jgi:hypothetical protein|uniref:hypothetical protein n=1 Tax=Mesorhizobium sp. TaxID=1871066 RepID=UPI002DDD7992|nr:hypothetical protein [Mesorhizobium sp.]HEV2504074.1 hypothetical protein [Mesorhizobium sp.]